MQQRFGEWTPRTGFLPALSIQQPYAWRIVSGFQAVEHRNWKTSYRGPLLIHAPKGVEKEAMVDLPTGGIVGIAILAGICDEASGPSRYGFLLRDMRPLPFVPFKGALGLFAVPESVLGPQEQHSVDLSHLAEDNLPEGSITPHFWQVQNAPVQFDHRGKSYNGVVLEWSNISRRENDYDLCKVEVVEVTTHTYVDWNNMKQVKTSTKRYVWPEPIQSYKLRKRVS